MEVRSAETGSAVGAVFYAVFLCLSIRTAPVEKATVVVLCQKRLELWR